MGLPAILVLLAIVIAAMGASHAAQPARLFGEEASKQAEIYNSAGQRVPEGYIIGRSLLSYAFTLSPEFRHALARLGAQDRWLDIGAGEGHAVLDYRASKYDVILQGSKEGDKAQAVAMSIEDRRTSRWHEAAAGLDDTALRYVFGRRLREYSRDELGQFQLMTDVLGGFWSTRYASIFMEKALGLLAVNGSFFTLLQDVQTETGSNRPFYPGSPFLTELLDNDGSQMKVCSWLKQVTCVEVTCEQKLDSSPPVETYHIRKVCNRVTVPHLVPVHFASGTPPERRFRLTNAPPDVREPAATMR